MATGTAGTSRRRSSGKTGERYCEDLSFAAKEAFKRLRTNLVMSFPTGDTSCHMIGITSAQPSDGKSTIAINLAFTLAELGKRVLLMDADMRRSSIHEKAGVEKVPGLSDLLSKSSTISDSIKRYVNRKGEASFDIITGGNIPQNPSELLNSARMSALLQTLSESYDYIVIDLPPIGAVVDAISVAGVIDGMLVVVRENACPRRLLSECMSQLEYAKINVFGFVVNGAMEGSGKSYQYGKYGSSGYYSSYY